MVRKFLNIELLESKYYYFLNKKLESKHLTDEELIQKYYPDFFIVNILHQGDYFGEIALENRVLR